MLIISHIKLMRKIQDHYCNNECRFCILTDINVLVKLNRRYTIEYFLHCNLDHEVKCKSLQKARRIISKYKDCENI